MVMQQRTPGTSQLMHMWLAHETCANMSQREAGVVMVFDLIEIRLTDVMMKAPFLRELR